MICNDCKNEIPDNSKFCLECGFKVETNRKSCPNEGCGKTNLPKDAIYCPDCGTCILILGMRSNGHLFTVNGRCKYCNCTEDYYRYFKQQCKGNSSKSKVLY